MRWCLQPLALFVPLPYNFPRPPLALWHLPHFSLCTYLISSISPRKRTGITSPRQPSTGMSSSIKPEPPHEASLPIQPSTPLNLSIPQPQYHSLVASSQKKMSSSSLKTKRFFQLKRPPLMGAGGRSEMERKIEEQAASSRISRLSS